MPDPVDKQLKIRSFTLVLLGGLFALIGLPLPIGGACLAVFGGSNCYLLAGWGGRVRPVADPASGRVFGCISDGPVGNLENRPQRLGLVLPIIGPALFVILVMLALPLLLPAQWRWRTALAVATGIVVALVAGEVLISVANRTLAGPDRCCRERYGANSGRRRLAGLWRH